MRYGLVIATESEMEVFHRRYRVSNTGLMRLKGLHRPPIQDFRSGSLGSAKRSRGNPSSRRNASPSF